MRLLALLAAGLLAGPLLAADDKKEEPKKEEKKRTDEELIVGKWAVDSFDAGGLPGGPTQEEARKKRWTFKKEG